MSYDDLPELFRRIVPPVVPIESAAGSRTWTFDLRGTATKAYQAPPQQVEMSGTVVIDDTECMVIVKIEVQPSWRIVTADQEPGINTSVRAAMGRWLSLVATHIFGIQMRSDDNG